MLWLWKKKNVINMAKKKKKVRDRIYYSKIPNKMHLDAQIRFPHRVQKDKTKYTRKTKHKNKDVE